MFMKIYFYIFFITFFNNTAHAYWDPGTGSAILQAILALIGSIIVYLGIFKQKVKELIKTLKPYFKPKATKDDENK